MARPREPRDSSVLTDGWLVIHVRAVRKDDAEVWRRMRVALWPDGGQSHAREIEEFFAGTLHMPLEVLLALDEGGAGLGFAELSGGRSSLPRKSGHGVNVVPCSVPMRSSTTR